MAVRFPDPIHPVDPVELEINQLFDRLIMCLQERRDTVLATYRDTRVQIAARHITRATKEQELIGLKTDTEARLQMNELRHVQTKILAEIEQELREVRVPQPETHVVFRGNCGHLEQLIAGVGEVVEEEMPNVPRYEDMRPIVFVAKKGLAPGDLWNPCGVAISEGTSRIYVADSGSRRVSIFSETGAFIDTLSHKDMVEPHGIAIHRDILYVTDRGAHVVFKFKIAPDMRFVANLGNPIFGAQRFKYPLGLSVSAKGDVFVADSSNHRIQVLDDSLHIRRSITHQTMKSPRDVKLTPDEVFVLCPVSPCLLVFSHAGEKIRSLVTLGDGMQIGSAFFFCLDKKQNLLISDRKNKQVRIFSKEGTHLYSMGQLGHEAGMFYSPRGIVLTRNLKLIIVSKNPNSSLHILSSQ